MTKVSEDGVKKERSKSRLRNLEKGSIWEVE